MRTRKKRERGKKRFSFFSLEEGKWLMKRETQEASTQTIGNKKQERMETERRIFIYIYNISESFIMTQCQSV
jgi:hypothetical protein